jgi:hypothetical protein
MRKVLSFVLVLSLVLGSFGMAFAAPLSDMAGEKSEEAVSVLTELGVVKGYPDGTYKPDNIVTRAEMAVIVVSALGLADYATGTSNFSDMGGHWSNGFVAYATSLGIISGYPDGTFRPDNTVTYDEAATMLVAALGYNADSLIGTWPANFVTKAKTLGILDGIKAGATGANRGDIAIMTFQTLDQEIGRTNADGDWEGAKTAGKEDTMLKRLGAKPYNDTDNDGVAEPFLVTKTEADAAVMNLMPYIGAWVTAYMNSDGDIIAVKEVKSTFLTGEFDGIGTFSAGDVDYTVSTGAQADITPTASAIGFKNGDVVADFFDSIDTTDGEYTLAVDVSGKTIKEVYSVLEWEVTDHGRFAAADATDISEDQELFGVSFPLDDDGEIDLNAFELVGVDSLDDIKKDNVVYVYENGDNEIARVAVGTEVVSGEITKKTSTPKYTVGGKAYGVASQIGLSVASAKAGDEVELYLDYAGDIYYLKEVAGEADTYAVLLEAANSSGSGKFAEVAQVYLFLADGTDKVFDVDDDIVVKFDSSITYSAATISSAAVGTSSGALIKYSVDKDGVIDDIEFASKLTAVTGKSISEKGNFDGKAINSDAVIFTFDGTDKEDADSYGVTTLAKLLDTSVVSYYYDVDSNRIAAMVVDSDATSDDEVYGVVTSKAENNSDAGYEVTMLIDGKSVTKDLKASAGDYAAVTKAALYAVTFTAAGEAKLSTSLAPNATQAAVVVTSGALKLDGYVLEWTTTTGITTGAGTALFDAAGDLTLDRDVVVYVWDDGEFEVGNLRDIIRSTGTITFYDLVDDDKVYDIVLIK